MKPIVIASDHGGFALKEKLKPHLESLGFKVKDLGTHSPERCDFPKFAFALAKEISQGKFKRGVLLCRSGIGTSIVANRVPGVRAALCYNIKAAKLSREHNDSNVLVLGADFININLAKKIVRVWLNTKFLEGRYRERLNQIEIIEKEIRSKRK